MTINKKKFHLSTIKYSILRCCDCKGIEHNSRKKTNLKENIFYKQCNKKQNSALPKKLTNHKTSSYEWNFTFSFYQKHGSICNY